MSASRDTIDWGKPVGDGRPLADSEVVPRLRDIQKQIGGSYAIDRAIEVLEGLQDAHPEQPPEIQDILDYLGTVLHPIISPEHWNVYSELHDMISCLPSAQPELIRCKDCKYSEHWYKDKTRCFLWHETGIDVFEDGYCNYAKRRTDEDVRGKQDE